MFKDQGEYSEMDIQSWLLDLAIRRPVGTLLTLSLEWSRRKPGWNGLERG